MSDTINIGGIQVSKFYLGGSSDVKIYLGTTKLYPHLQEPCFAVVDNISTYTARTYVDVYETSSDKWYKLNNLSVYEEYGVYGSTTATTYYDGKLVIQDGYEYQYSGSGWNNVGEISGSSRVPAGYSEAEYVENQNMACINTGFKPNQNTRLITEMQTVSTTSYVNHFGAGGWNEPNALILDYENGYNGSLHLTWGTATGWTVVSSVRGDYNKHTYDWNKNEVYRDNTLVKTFTYGNYQAVSNLYIFTTINNGSSTPSLSQYYYMKGKLYSCQIYDNGTLVRDMIPCTRDSDSKAGVYDIVNDVFYSSANSRYELVAGPTVTGGTIVYPMYYETKQDPPNNLSFSSMTEAEEYECPWVGMVATIDGVKYVFSGDSISGYEWVEYSGRLPQGYTEVEYIRQNSNYNAYINTGVYLFDNITNSYTVTMKLTSEFHSNLGCATIISAEVPASPYNGMGYRYKCSSTVDQLEFFGGNANYASSVVDNGDGTRTVTFQSTGNTSWTSSAPLSLLCSFSDTSFTTPFRYSDVTIYSSTVVKNGVTVRDFVPAKRDSDSVYGLYDLITNTFYTSPNGNNFIGGNPV